MAVKVQATWLDKAEPQL